MITHTLQDILQSIIIAINFFIDTHFDGTQFFCLG
jgi:hypothetical protein